MKCGKWRRVIGAFVAVLLICACLAGCSNGDAGSKGNDAKPVEEWAEGRFLEEELDIGVELQEIFDLKRMEEGSLRIVGQEADSGNIGVWESADAGKTWKSAYDLPTEVQGAALSYLCNAALSPSGQIVCALVEFAPEGSDSRVVFYLVDKEGKANKMSFELPKKEGEGEEAPAGDTEPSETGEGETQAAPMNFVTNLRFPGNDWIVLQDSTGTVYQINVSDSSVKYTYEFEAGMSGAPLYTVGNTLIVHDKAEIRCFDLQTGEQKPAEETLSQIYSENGNFRAIDTLDGGESIYILSQGGMYHCKFGGSVIEHIIEGNSNSLGEPSFLPNALAMIDEQNLLVAGKNKNASSEMETCVVKYTYSTDTPAKPEKELKVYSLYENMAVRQCISLFQKEHSDVSISFEAAISEENGMTVSDALKALTTEIMVGNGPDVLILDGMPVDAYIEKGVLKDLSGLLKESGDSYFENIFNAYLSAQGELCAAPARFKIPMIQAGSKYFSPGEDFNTFMARKDTMVNLLPKEVVEKFWYTCGAAWQKEDKTFDESKITEFLTKLKGAYGAYDSNVENDKPSLANSSVGEGTEIVSDTDFLIRNMDLVFGKCNTNFGLYKEMDYGMHRAVNEKLEDGAMDLMPGQADHVFVPALVLGVSSKSAQQEMAVEFVKYMFSQEAQKIRQFGGFSVEKESFRGMIDGHEYEGKDMGASCGNGGGEIFEYSKEVTPEEEIIKLTELVESLTTPSLQDDVIKETVVEQGAKVLRGEQSPEEGAAAIMQKVNIYLAE